MTDPVKVTGNELELADPMSDSDGVNLQCINSSDFVIGKQTTFNGPVTIINCAEGVKEEEQYKSSKEEIVIKEKIITPSTVSEIQAFVAKKTDGNNKAGQSENRNGGFIRKLLQKNFLKIPVLLWILLVIIIIAGFVVFFTTLENSSESAVIAPQRKSRAIRYNGKDFNFISREEWNARPPLLPVEMKIPVKYVVISHTASRFCYLEADCKSLIRDIQADHMTRSPPFSDIAYSFMVGGDGNIYEGRGWTVRDAVTGFANAKNININFIGSFEYLDAPTYPQTEAVKALIDYGVNNSYIDENYSLISANTTYATLSPGIQVYYIISEWPHFDPNPSEHLNE